MSHQDVVPFALPHGRSAKSIRVETLWKDYHVLPYVMAYNNDKTDPSIRALVRYANRKELITSMDFKDYDRNPEYRIRKRTENTFKLEVEND